jgi:hypothetical protein
MNIGLSQAALPEMLVNHSCIERHPAWQNLVLIRGVLRLRDFWNYVSVILVMM